MSYNVFLWTIFALGFLTCAMLVLTIALLRINRKPTPKPWDERDK